MKRYRTSYKPSAKHVGTVQTILNLWNCQYQYDRGMEIIHEVCLRKGIKFNPDDFLTTQVNKSRQLKRTAGYANALLDTITLHAALFDQADQLYHDRFETFFHELAHIITDNVLKEKNGHGDNWKFVFSCFGFIPKIGYYGLDYNGYHDREIDRLADELGDAFDGLEF